MVPGAGVGLPGVAVPVPFTPFLSPVGAEGRQRPTGHRDREASGGAPGPGEEAPGGLQN